MKQHLLRTICEAAAIVVAVFGNAQAIADDAKRRELYETSVAILFVLVANRQKVVVR